jgi:hypothetical protein
MKKQLTAKCGSDKRFTSVNRYEIIMYLILFIIIITLLFPCNIRQLVIIKTKDYYSMLITFGFTQARYYRHIIHISVIRTHCFSKIRATTIIFYLPLIITFTLAKDNAEAHLQKKRLQCIIQKSDYTVLYKYLHPSQKLQRFSMHRNEGPYNHNTYRQPP